MRALSPTGRLLTDVLGFRYAGSTHIDDHNAGIYDIGPGGPGAVMIVVERPDLRQHRLIGAGGVHHVAFRTPDEAQHARWREKLTRAGVGVTPIIDRFYFRSMYFREPGGVLFEIATDGPGFAVDEAEAHLGEQLSLPPFLEPQRAEIEASLRPITPVAIDPVGA